MDQAPIEKEDERMEDTVEELTELEQIQRKVFTGMLPEKLLMRGPDNYIDRAKSLGVYEPSMKRDHIDTAVAAYWIKKCGGRDKYMASNVFVQAKQDLDRPQKERHHVKRKREFADMADDKSGDLQRGKRKHKAPLSKDVSKALVNSDHCHSDSEIIFCFCWL